MAERANGYQGLSSAAGPLCPCGHAAKKHGETGGFECCWGDMECLCSRSEAEALEAASAMPLVGGGQGRTPDENEDTGSALAGLCKWTLVLVVASLLIWGAARLLREDTPPRNPPFSELPDSRSGDGR